MQSLLEYGGMWHLVQPQQQQGAVAVAASASSHSSSASSVGTVSSAKQREAHFILASAIHDPETRRLLISVKPTGCPRALWLALEHRFLRMPKAAASALFSQLLQLRQSSSESVRAFADRITSMRHQLAANGKEVADEEVITVLLNGVHASLQSTVATVFNLTPNPHFEQMVEVARGEETRLSLQQRGAAAATRPPAGTTAALAASSSSSSVCHYCKQPGHFKSDCSKLKSKRAELTATEEEVRAGACSRPGHKHHKAVDCHSGGSGGGGRGGSSGGGGGGGNRQAHVAQSNSLAPAGGSVVYLGVARVSQVSQAAVAALSTSSDAGRIVLDSGAGSTVIPSTTELRDAVPAPDTRITVANGAVLPAPLRGTAVLRAGGTTFLVKNALQHPQIDRPLLSVAGILGGSGNIERIVFDKAGAQALSATGDIIFTATQESGVYLVDTAGESRNKQAGSEQHAGAVTAAAAEAAAAQGGGAATGATLHSSSSAESQLWHHRLCHRSYDLIRQLVASGAVRGLEDAKLPPPGKEHTERCAGCAEGKAHRCAFHKVMDASRAAQHVLSRVSADVAGPLSVPSLAGARYFLVVVDQWSHYVSVFFMAHKSEAAHNIITWARQAHTRHGRNIVVFHSDGGGEFVNSTLGRYFNSSGTEQTTTTPHTPQHNGQSERLIRTLMEGARAALSHAGAAKKFWAHAVNTVAHVLNHVKVLPAATGEGSSTPLTRWQQLAVPPSVTHMRVWGCDADVVFTVAPGQKLSKLDPKSRLCMLVGYAADKLGWLFFDPHSGSVLASRDAKFYEQQFTVSHAVRAAEQAADDGDGDDSVDEEHHWLTRTTFDNETRLMEIVSREQAAAEAAAAGSGSSSGGGAARSRSDSRGDDSDDDEGGEDMDSQPSSGAASADEQEKEVSHSRLPGESSSSQCPSSSAQAAAPAPSAAATAGPRRTPRINAGTGILRYGMTNNNLAQGRAVFVALAESYSKVPLERSVDTSTPSTHAEAMSSPAWKEAVERELAAHAQNGTWVAAQLPAGCKAIGYKWVFKLKLNPDGTVERHKCRLTAKGYAQREGTDYNDTFAPTLHFNTLRILLAIVAADNYELHHLDVETAFLNARVKEDLYMLPPEGVACPAGSVLKLQKALYGIKQAPHEWHAEIRGTLLSIGYSACEQDQCLFIKRSRTARLIYFPLFVDDCFPACHTFDVAELEADKRKLMEAYKVKDLGEAALVLGMRVTRDREARTLKLDQQVYVDKLLEEYGMVEVKTSLTPEQPSASTAEARTVAGDEAATAAGSSGSEAEERAEARAAGGDSIGSGTTTAAVSTPDPAFIAWYSALIGALLYLSIATRPDISHAVNVLSRVVAKPTPADRVAALRVLRYLKGTTTLGIQFGGKVTERRFEAYSDANWAAAAPADARSTSGWLLKIGTGPISWSSKKQTVTALSSTESEYIAASSAAREVIWTRRLMGELGITSASAPPTPLYCDNRAAKSLSESPSIGNRSKHINTRFHFIRECVADGSLRIEWLSGKEQPADLLTKPLGPQTFLKLRGRLMGDC
jgi:hypothetical protein